MFTFNELMFSVICSLVLAPIATDVTDLGEKPNCIAAVRKSTLCFFATDLKASRFLAISGVTSDVLYLYLAAAYGNEKEVGEGIRNSGIDRESIFITSKLWNTNCGYENTKRAFQQTIDDLQVDYLDLFLIHWPADAKQFPDTWGTLNSETWRALEDLYNEGKIKSIGVSNFSEHHLESLFKTATIRPMVNQVEVHPGHQQRALIAFNKAYNILVEAWEPLGQSRLVSNETLIAIGKKYQKTSAQVFLRWSLQHGLLPLPKSIKTERIKKNYAVCDFELSAEDMDFIDAMSALGGSGLNPDQVDF